MNSVEFPPDSDSDRGFQRAAGVGVLIGVVAAALAGATIWLLLTDPVTVASAIDGGEISPLVRQLLDVVVNALRSLLQYL